jgi:hypothetical protein
MTQQWAIGLAPWIIRDGNYPDFERGQQVEFAVEFWYDDPPHEASGAPSASLIQESDYLVTARVEHTSAEAWVIDCGIAMYRDVPAPEGIARGGVVSGRVGIGVDHFAYFEQLHAVPGMPPLIYTWIVDSIELYSAPMVEVNGIRQYDAARASHELIEQTDAWLHGTSTGQSYILHCTLLDVPPKHQRTTM